jgi:PAS domain S-box-containing protein
MVAVYALMGWRNFVWAVPLESAIVLVPPGGLGMAVLAVLGLRFWPVPALGAALVHWIGDSPPPVAFAQSLGHTFECWAGAFLLRRFGCAPTLGRIQDVIRLFVFGSAAAASMGAALSTGMLALATGSSWVSGLAAFGHLWLRGAVSVAVFAPAAVTWLSRDSTHRGWRDRTAFSLFVAATLAFVAWSFAPSTPGPMSDGHALSLLAFLLTLIVSAQFGPRAGALTVLLIMAVATRLMGLGSSGPPMLQPQSETVFLHVFILALSASASGLAALLSERQRTMDTLHESEERFRAFAQSSSDWHWEQDARLRFTYVSLSNEAHSGMAPSMHIGKTRRETDPLDVTEDMWRDHDAVLAARQPLKDFRFVRIGADGRRHTLSVSGQPFFGRGGAFLGYRGIGRDVTQEVEAREAIARIEQRLLSSIEGRSEAIALWDADDKLVVSNSAFRHYSGAAGELLIPGVACADFIRALAERGVATEAKGREDEWIDDCLRRHLGPWEPFELLRGGRWLLARGQRTPDGGTLEIFTDITELKRSQARLAEAVDSLPGGFAMFDADERLVLMSAQSRETYAFAGALVSPGTKYEDLIRAVYRRVLDYDSPEELEAFIRQRLEVFRRPGRRMETRFKDGRWMSTLDRRTPSGETVTVQTDITHLKTVEERLARLNADLERRVAERTQEVTAASAELAKANAELLAVIESSPIAIVSTDVDGRVVHWNPAMEKLSGFVESEVVGRRDPSIPAMHEEDYDAVLRNVAAGQPVRGLESTRRRLDGTVVDVVTSASPLIDVGRRGQGVLFLVEDVTERRNIERQLQQAQKMEAIGQLTGGLAHDLNNLLGIIIGNLDMLSEAKDIDTNDRQMIDAALSASLKGAELNRSLLAFARRQPLRVQRVEPRTILRDIVAILRRTLSERVEIRLDLAESLWPVRIDAAQLEAAILNVAVNARDAMPDGGTIAIRADNLRDRPRDLAPDVEGREFVRIAITDTGVGMPAEVLARVFEPFFTTKPVGRGTGLGLSMVYGFARQSGGDVRVESQLGRGTVVTLYLPRIATEVAIGLRGEEGLSSLPGGSEAVLVVEDNAALRRIVVRQLQDLGYAVVAAPDGMAALDILKSDRAIDLLFSDIVMPGGMDGTSLAREAARIRPDLRILLTSGFIGDAAAGNDLGEIDFPVLFKPYRRRDMAVRLRELLESRHADLRRRSAH